MKPTRLGFALSLFVLLPVLLYLAWHYRSFWWLSVSLCVFAVAMTLWNWFAPRYAALKAAISIAVISFAAPSFKGLTAYFSSAFTGDVKLAALVDTQPQSPAWLVIPLLVYQAFVEFMERGGLQGIFSSIGINYQRTAGTGALAISNSPDTTVINSSVGDNNRGPISQDAGARLRNRYSTTH